MANNMLSSKGHTTAYKMENVQHRIENNDAEYDPAWAWKQAMKKYTTPPASASLETRKHTFVRFMNSFLLGYKEKDVKAVRFDGSMTWADVQKEATAAFDEYTRQGKSWRHPFRSTGRAFGSVACRIEFLFQLIPSGDYFGVLCAGLTLVYNAARRKREIRGMIIRTLDSLSELIEGSKSFIQMYTWNDELKQRTEDLYIAILEAVEGITEWLKQSPLGKALKSFVTQSDYGTKLEEKLSRNIEDKAALFSAVIAQCLHAAVNTTHHNVLTLGKRVEHIDGGISSVNERLNEVGSDVNHGLSTVHQGLERLRLHERERKQAEFIQQLNMNMFNIGNLLMYQQAPLTVTILQLLALLSLEHLNPSDNYLEQKLERIRAEHDFVIFHGRQLNPQHQAAVTFVMQNPLFQEWFKSMASQTLVVHGMDSNFNPAEMVSPFSYMCAMLAQTTGRHNHLHPLAYFCRLHLDTRDAAQGPNGMIRSLATQVLLALASMHQNPGLSFIGYAEIQAIQAQDLPSLCRLFEELLKRVWVGIIFCMLDETPWFESDTYVSGMHAVMQFLNSLVEAVERSQSGLVFKLIITNPLTSQYCQNWFPNRVEIFAPASGLLEGQGFNTLSMFLS
ncbi:hypothetical protein PT974_09839 [Cladobotryum mycophilum]|uniref:Uncharacterized protein n=1 Tax=Cladobotryum mycophilum TaxID=491253 RepID=A0ABR0SHD8_9HYPO